MDRGKGAVLKSLRFSLEGQVKKYLRRVMTEREMDVALSRIAAEIIQDDPGLEDSLIVGIRRRGVPLAELLQEKITAQVGQTIECGSLDITFYRDDFSLVATQPVVHGSQLPFPIDQKKILLVDDVLYTGRTIRAALESVLDYGRPDKVVLVVLVDRGHRELPIQADYVGKVIETAENEMVEVRLPPVDNEQAVYLSTLELMQQRDGDD